MSENEIFSSYSDSEKKELLQYITKYKFQIRDSLNLEEELKFGIELEIEGKHINSLIYNQCISEEIFESTPLMHYETYFHNFDYLEYDYENGPWILKPDSTVLNGGEIHSPILTDNIETWNNVSKICQLLQRLEAESTKNTALQVHFSHPYLISDVYDLYNLIKLYSAYENVLYYFGTGEYTAFRNQLFALPMASEIKAKLKNIKLYNLEYEKLLKKLDFTFFRGLRLNNLSNKANKKTIEFRFANSTLIPAIIQNHVNTCGKLVRYVLSDKFDDDFVTRKFNYMKLPISNIELLKQYSNPPLEDILEFADLIFDNTLDKLNFLRQCIKQPAKKTKSLQKAKKFY